jgi:hypothetical protein
VCTIKRELNKILVNECRCDKSLNDKVEGFTCLVDTGFGGGLEHLERQRVLRLTLIITFFVYHVTRKGEINKRHMNVGVMKD